MAKEQHKDHPKLAELKAKVRAGDIDTLIVALTDMQGRLMGKRVQGQAFLNGAIDHGAHFCTYLLGTDMEMNTPDGFQLMNWETGYGDWIADPVWDTMRVVPWLEKTALVLSDTVDHHGHEIAVSPRTMLKRVRPSSTSASRSTLPTRAGSASRPPRRPPAGRPEAGSRSGLGLPSASSHSTCPAPAS